MSVEIVDDIAAFEALRIEWNEATESAVDSNVFLTWEWLRTWWRHFGEGTPGVRLHVVVIRGEHGIVAAAPWFKATSGVGPLRATRLQQIGYDAGDYGGIVLVRDVEHAVGTLLSHLADQLRSGVSAAVLSRLASDSLFLRRIRSGLADQVGVTAEETVLDGAVCPFADIRDGYDLQPRLRKNRVPQRLRRLGEKYEVAFEYHSGPNLESGITALVDLHRRRWEDRPGEFQGLLADAKGEAFLLDAIRALDNGRWLRLLTLTADGRPIATRLDFEFAGRLYMLKNAIDPDFGEFGPGHLTHAHAFEEGMARGVEEFDFLRGDHAYKRRWSTGERHLVAVNLTRSGFAGRMAAGRSRVARRLATTTRPM